MQRQFALELGRALTALANFGNLGTCARENRSERAWTVGNADVAIPNCSAGVGSRVYVGWLGLLARPA
jgi:hypothetical protein